MLVANAMKSYPGAKYLNTRDCALEGPELFGSTKQKFDLSPNVDCNLHQPNKVNNSILHLNTKAKRTCIEMSFKLCKAWCVSYHIGVGD